MIGLFEWIHTKGNEHYRSIIFGTYGLSMFIPLTHLAINEFVFDNYGDPFRFSSAIPYYIMLAAFYCTGLYIFSVRYSHHHSAAQNATTQASTTSADTATKSGTSSS